MAYWKVSSDGSGSSREGQCPYPPPFRGKYPETDRLKLARQLLLSLGVLTVGFFAWYAMAPENPALQAIFELFKIGVLPLITLIVSFYFSRTDQ